MPAMNRVQVAWTGVPTLGGGLSTFYFDGAVGTATQQVAAVTTFFTGLLDKISSTLTFATLADVAILDSATGDLQGFATTAPQTGGGGVVTEALPIGAQGLCRLLTNVIVNKRLLRGRLFIPGPTEADNTVGGVPSAAYIADVNAAITALINDANTAWVIWSRTHGQMSPVASGTCWNKWALLRSRRD